jgi:hypothetical protein
LNIVKFLVVRTVALAIVLAAAPASAQVEPRACGVFGGSACLTLAQIGPGQRQGLLLGTRPYPNARRPSGELNTLNDLFAAVRACWVPPPLQHAEPGMEMTMRFSFNRDGKLIGPPQLTYAKPDVSVKVREVYREALARSLQSCTPLPFTSGLGAAIAGRPVFVTISDDRDNSGIKPRV